jgi:hypothetical protein
VNAEAGGAGPGVHTPVTTAVLVRHVSNILAKIGASTRAEAASWAVREGITSAARSKDRTIA